MIDIYKISKKLKDKFKTSSNTYHLNYISHVLKVNFFILSVYTILTVILTYPVAFKISSYIPGDSDAFYWMRILWYTPIAIFNPEITTLTHDNLLFYPDGISSIPFSSAFNQLLTFILLKILDLHVVYTILWLLSFILGAYGAYLLVNYLTKNGAAAFISGIIFAFSPYHFVHALGHFGAITIQWIPFCALYLMKMFKEGGTKNSFLAGLFFILVAMSDLQYMVFMGLFVLLLFIYELYFTVKEHKGTRFRKIKILYEKYIVFGVVSFAGVLPLSYNEIITALSGNNFLKLNPEQAITYSTDLLSFVLPSRLHPIFGNYVGPIYSNFSGNMTEHTAFIGYTVFLLSAFILLKKRKDITIRFWSVSALFFTLMSLGPLLSINGRTTFTDFNTTIPMPHLVLYYVVPFLDNCRTTGRFFVIATLSFGVLAGYGIKEIMESFKENKNKKNIFTILIFVLIIFEYLSVPFPVSYVDQPEFYKEIASDQEEYALLEFPVDINYEGGVEIVYYQTIHGKPIVGGQVARTPAGARNFELNTPFVREFVYLKTDNDILNQNVTEIGDSVLDYYNIKYVVLHEEYLDDEQLEIAMDLANATLKEKPVFYEEDGLIVYSVDNVDFKTFMSISEGWHGLEKWDNVPSRWITNNATLEIISKENTECDLNFDIISFAHPRTLKVYVNNEPEYQAVVPTNLITLNVPISLRKGTNEILFFVVEGTDNPSDFGSSDSRDISLGFQNVTLYRNN